MGHSLSLRYSDDGGRNFTRWKAREKGVTGAFLTELKWDRLGETRAREWEICDTSNVAADVLAAALMIEPSTSWADFPLPDGSYSDATREFTQQDVVNFLPTFAEGPGTRSRAKYTPAPGLLTFCTVGTGPHRGGRDVEGKCFVVSGSTLYQIATDGTATSIGTIPGTGLVSMTHNQIANGNQLLIGTGDNSYVYNTVTGALTANGIPLLSVDFLNQLNLGVDQARRFWRYSGLADATSWNTLDNESAESSPDRIIGGIVAQGEWLVFGERTIEPWGNDPTATNSTEFQRNTGAISERGCINANTIKRLDNSVFFIDNNFIPCRLNGYQPVPIAPKAIVDALSQSDPAKLLAYTWEDKGYVVYYITAQDGQTFGYDCTSQKWHRRESFGLDRWRLNTLFKWNGDWYGGDAFNGKFYRLTWGNVYEGCDLMPRRIRTGVLHSNGNKLRVSGAKLLVQTGGAESTAQEGDPPSITGALPDGVVGDVVDYQYTITRAYPGQIVTLTLTGALPTGLSLNGTGRVTGTLTTTGTFSWAITPSGQCTTGAAFSDTAAVTDSLASAIIADAPILYWKLNETSGTTVVDYSGFARNGTTTGSPTKSSSGLTLTALPQGVYYPGNVAGTPLDVGVDTGWAIEAIITRAAPGGSVYEWIAGQWYSPNFGYENSYLALKGTGTGAGAGKPDGGFTDSGGLFHVGATGSAVIATSTRTHLMIVRDPGSGGTGALRIYQNGTQVGSSTGFASTSVGVRSNIAKFLVGSDTDAAGYYPDSYGFLGKIEHVAVYDTTITAARALYHAHVAGLA